VKTTRRDVLRSALWLSAVLGSGSAGTIARAAGQGSSRKFKRVATEESFMTKEVFGSLLELLADHPESEPGFAHFFETALGKPGEFVANLSSAC
jgi:hypothetical protein